MKVDIRASLRLWDIDLYLDGRVFPIPAMPAADWLDLLADDFNPLAILRLVDDKSIGMVDVSDTDLVYACLDVIGEASGRHGMVAVALVQAAAERWDIVGPDLAVLDLENVPFGRALDLILKSLLTHAKDEQAINQIVQYFDSLETSGTMDAPGLVLPGLGRRPHPSPVPATAEPYVTSRPKTLPRPIERAGRSPEPTPPPAIPVGSGRLATNVGLSSAPPTYA